MFALAVAMLALVACNGGSSPPKRTAIPNQPVATPTALFSTDVQTTIETVVLACREKNAPALGTLIFGPLSSSQIRDLFTMGRDVVLKGQTPTVTGDTAIVVVDLEITRDTGTERVERTWALVRAPDGFWRVNGVPDCY